MILTKPVPFSPSIFHLRLWQIAAMTLGLSFAFFVPTPARAISLSPPEVTVDGLLRGTTQARTVSLGRSVDEVGDIYIRVEPGEEGKDFFVLDTREVVLLAGKNSVDYSFGITPGSAANGEYDLRLRFLKIADPAKLVEGQSVAVVTGVTAKVMVVVGGEERVAYELGSINAQETEEGLDVPLTYFMDNTGNIDWRPSKIVFIFSNQDGQQAGQGEISGQDVPVSKAGQEKQRFDVRVPVELSRGSYTAQASFYDGEEIIGTLSTSYPFEVHPAGTLAKSGVLNGLSLSKSTFSPSEKIKVNAPFQNNGQVDLTAVLALELLREGEVVDFIRGKEYSVNRGEEVVLTEFLDVSQEGSYSIEGSVEYGGRKTEAKQASFEVRAGNGALGADNIPMNSFAGIVGLSIVIMMIATGAILLHRHRKKSESIPPLVSLTSSDQVEQPNTSSAPAPVSVTVSSTPQAVSASVIPASAPPTVVSVLPSSPVSPVVVSPVSPVASTTPQALSQDNQLTPSQPVPPSTGPGTPNP